MHNLSRRSSRARIASFIGTSAVAILAACGGGGSQTTTTTEPPIDTPPAMTATVSATPSDQFTPNTVTILAGGTVTYAFGSVAHNVFFDSGPQGAPANITAPSSDKSLTLTFTTAGTFAYNCHIHPGMRGTVIVK